MKRSLPTRVYLRHGSYHYCRLDGKWVKLSRERDGLPAMYRALANLTESTRNADMMPAVITRWLDERKAEGEWSDGYTADQERIAAVMARKLAQFRPSQLTAAACKQYLSAFVQTKRTYNWHRTMLRQVMSFAALEGLRDGHNPVDDVPTKTLAGRKRIVTDAELAALKKGALQATRNGEALVQMIDLATLTGQRIGDLIRLRWQDVTDAGILVQQGKTGERLLIEWTPALRAAIAACVRGDKIGHVLQTQSGRGYRYAGIRSAWVRACERAGVEDLNIHDLRGRAGVDAMGEEQDIRAAQKLLGHKSEAMSRHYTEGKYHKKVKPSK